MTLFLILTLNACSQAGNKETAMAGEMPAPSMEAEKMADKDEYLYDDQSGEENRDQSAGKPEVQRQIIRTGNLRFQVDHVKQSSTRVEEIVARFGGYVSGMTLTNTSYQISNYFQIRVPASRFDSLMNALEGEALFVNSRSTNTQDVTEEYLDIETRLKTKKEVRDRYVDILRNKAKTVEEVLKAEEAIRVLQEEIEAREGRLRYLKDQVAMSTIDLEIYEEVTYQPEPKTFKRTFVGRALTGLQNGWEAVVTLVIVLVNLWPFLLIIGVLIWQRKRIFRFRKHNPK